VSAGHDPGGGAGWLWRQSRTSRADRSAGNPGGGRLRGRERKSLRLLW